MLATAQNDRMTNPAEPEPETEKPAGGPRSDSVQEIGFTPQPAVRWLSPTELVRTGVQVAASTKLAEFLDRREFLGPSPDAADGTDLSAHPELWIDYVSDCGDGFDAAATVADALARETLQLGGETTPAGRLLVMGGDQAYPYASMNEYQNRLVGPYRSMLPWTEEPRMLFAVPGNHDWYDGLASFLKQFCQGRWIGGWKTVQTRSYFAVDLPGPWQLWAIDIALGTDIDEAQLDYFRARAEALPPGAAIILCSAKPTWTETEPDAHAALDFFERSVLADHGVLRVSLTGDKHHYARYESRDGEQKIIAGGGGAYLSPTHHLDEHLTLPPAGSREAAIHKPENVVVKEFSRCQTYPDQATSTSLRRLVFRRIFSNGSLPALVAGLYALLAVPLIRAVLAFADNGWDGTIVSSLVLLVLVFLLGWALVAFANIRPTLDSTKTLLRRGTTWLGIRHTGWHLGVMAVPTVGVLLLCSDAAELPRQLIALVVAALVGATLGLLVLARYLLVADRRNVNSNELFSAMRLEDYKCFLRIHLRPDHQLRIYPVAVPRSRRWQFVADPNDFAKRWFAPAGGDPSGVAGEPFLIEEPITVSPRGSHRVEVTSPQREPLP